MFAVELYNDDEGYEFMGTHRVHHARATTYKAAIEEALHLYPGWDLAQICRPFSDTPVHQPVYDAINGRMFDEDLINDPLVTWQDLMDGTRPSKAPVKQLVVTKQFVVPDGPLGTEKWDGYLARYTGARAVVVRVGQTALYRRIGDYDKQEATPEQIEAAAHYAIKKGWKKVMLSWSFDRGEYLVAHPAARYVRYHKARAYWSQDAGVTVTSLMG